MIDAAHLTHRYGERTALADFSVQIRTAEIFAFLGPNGSGKTTLFRLLSTLIPLQAGELRIGGRDAGRETSAIRARLGVVFQSPSVDRKLTVAENLKHQGRLYGLTGPLLRRRSGEMLQRLGIAERRGDLVETLSGGLRRRVELAKGLLHEPRLLLLDEPSTGLDPGARGDLWQYLGQLRDERGVTVVFTTHLLEEAERADRIAILHEGRLVALGSPAELKSQVGGDSITLETDDPLALQAAIRSQFGLESLVVDGRLRLEIPQGHPWVPRLVEAFGPRIKSITLAGPTLEDVFIARTGHRFWTERGPQ